MKKPVVFVQGDTSFYRENNFAQNLLLKALSEGITDVNELRKIAGMRTAADVYRTLDKMAIRKEYHAALSNAGLDLNRIVGGIKEICEGDASDAVRLKGWMVLLRSLGLDKYEKQEDSGKSWEEVILQASEQLKEDPRLQEAYEVDSYEVDRPEMPDEETQKRVEEKKLSDELYGSSGPEDTEEAS